MSACRLHAHITIHTNMWHELRESLRDRPFRASFLLHVPAVIGALAVWRQNTTQKNQEKVPKDSRVLGVRRGSRFLIASKPERPEVPANVKSQPWSNATCPCATAFRTLSCLFKQKECDKAEVSTSRGGSGAICVRPWLTRDIVSTGSFRRVWARCRGDWRSGNIHSVLLTPGYLLALLREFSHVPQGLTKIAEAKQVRKTNQTGILYQI